MSITRRTLLKNSAFTAACFSIGTGAARASEFTYKYATNLADSHPLVARAKEAADKIKNETGGRLEIRVFSNGQLGSDSDMLSQLRSGALEFFHLSGTLLSVLVPVASINSVGFAFKDDKSAFSAMDGDLGAHIRAQIAKANIYTMDKIWGHGYRQITSSTKPINAAGDLDGFRIRMPATPLWTSMFAALGAAPTTINFNELYSSLQTKIVDGQENPLAVIDTGKFYEVQKYCSLTNHLWEGYWWLASGRAWRGLPDDIKDIVSRNINAMALVQRQDIADLNLSLRGELEKKGLIFNTPDTAPFRERLVTSGFYSQWKERFGSEAWGLLEAYAGPLGA
ncbi:TRAP transporter substrate-binding protein [Brucella pseudogrignonensis]|uniref:TRAP transporter substrate-binding protein n=1 Tax=Brucella pseudogrignonensis TaxID=419475 RepID=UPI003ECD4469